MELKSLKRYFLKLSNNKQGIVKKVAKEIKSRCEIEERNAKANKLKSKKLKAGPALYMLFCRAKLVERKMQ